MRWKDIILEGSRLQPSPELVAWVTRWVESSHLIDDQIESFRALEEEASWFLNVRYPVIYRGLSITDEQWDELASGETITIPAHRLQSWTKSRSIAKDYALPGHGGDRGALIRKTHGAVKVVADIESMVRRIGIRSFSGDVRTDAGREREVVVETDGTLTIRHQDLVWAF